MKFDVIRLFKPQLMKPKYFFLLTFIFFCMSANTQNQNKSVSLSITASPFPVEINNAKDFGIIGKISLEFHTSKALSFQGSFYASNTTFFKNNSNNQINSLGVIPSVQYYFYNRQKFNVFGQLGYGFGFEYRTLYSCKIENSALTIFAVGAGANYRLNNKLYFQLHLPYFRAYNITTDYESASGLAVFFGFNFIIK